MEEKRQPVIQVKNLYKIFRVGDEKVRALNGVDLTIYKGEVLCHRRYIRFRKIHYAEYAGGVGKTDQRRSRGGGTASGKYDGKPAGQVPERKGGIYFSVL